MSDDRDGGVTWFGVTNGRATGVTGLLAGLVIVVIGVVEESVAGVVAGLVVAALTWLVLLRPRVGTRRAELLLRGMVSTVVVPLASVESVRIRQVLAVSAGGRRYVSPAIGRTFRDLNRQRRDAGQVEEIPVAGTKYADQVGDLITERAREARRDGLPTGPTRREWAWLELGVLALLAVALVVAVIL